MPDHDFPASRRAVFLDRDGVLVADEGIRTHSDGLSVLPGVSEALSRLAEAGFVLIVVTNQPVIARGLVTEQEVAAIHEAIRSEIVRQGGPVLTHFYFCPHHPKADVLRYRADCDCRKPMPGLIVRAAQEHGVQIHRSYMIGDRITDIIAGATAGCTTVLVETGRHLDPTIETSVAIDGETRPAHVCADLLSATDWILHR